MERHRAEAIVQAILEPDLAAREALRRKRAAEERRLAAGRFNAWCVLAGFAIGAAASHVVGAHFTVGGLWGGIAGAIVGRLLAAWRGRRHAR